MMHGYGDLEGRDACWYELSDYLQVRKPPVRVGHAFVTLSDESLALGRLGALCEQLKELSSQEFEVLVTADVVGVGRQRLRQNELANDRFFSNVAIHLSMKYLCIEFCLGKI